MPRRPTNASWPTDRASPPGHSTAARASAAAVHAVAIAVHVVAIGVSLAGPALLFWESLGLSGPQPLAAWRSVFADADRWKTLLANTSVVTAWTALLCIPPAIVLAVILFRSAAPLRRTAIACIVLIAAVPLYVLSGTVVSALGLQASLYSRFRVGLVHALSYLPIATLLIGMGLRTVAAEYEEAALVDGAGPAAMLWRVTLRLAGGGGAAAFVLVVLWVTTDYSVADLLMVRTFAEEVYTQFRLVGGAAQASLVALPQTLLLAALLWLLRRSLAGPDTTEIAPDRRLRLARGLWARIGGILAAAAIGAWFVFVAHALCQPLRHAHDPLDSALGFAPELTTSLWTSAAAGLVAATLALAPAWLLVRRPRWRLAIAAWMVVMLAVPAPVLGVGLIRLFNRPVLGVVYDSPAILVVAYVVRFLPIAVLLLVPAARAIPIDCEAAARLDGCGPVQTWVRIIWPLCLPGFVTALLVVMILSAGELPCSVLVTPPGYSTVGERFFTLMHSGFYPDVAVLCVLSIAVIVVPWAGLVVLLRRRLGLQA